MITGNGSSTSFSLNYSVSTSASVLVTVDGVYKVPTIDYGAQNKTISFASAPANTSQICIVFLGQSLLTPISAGNQIEINNYTGDNIDTTFDLTSIPVSNNGVFVYLDGILKKITDDYTIAGQTVTFLAAPSNGAKIELVNLGAEAIMDVASIPDGSLGAEKFVPAMGGTFGAWEIKSASFNAARNAWYMIDTTGGAVTMTLPASPSLGETIRFLDVAGAFNTNNLTIGRNGLKIQGITQDLTVDSQGAANALVYSNSTYGWRLMDL